MGSTVHGDCRTCMFLGCEVRTVCEVTVSIPLESGSRLVSGGGRQFHLGQAERVARGVAETGVDPVGALFRRLGELDAAGPELLVGGPAVVGGEEDAAAK